MQTFDQTVYESAYAVVALSALVFISESEVKNFVEQEVQKVELEMNMHARECELCNLFD
jgi:hypothetical protein